MALVLCLSNGGRRWRSDMSWWTFAGAMLIAIGVVLAIAAITAMVRAKTSVDPYHSTTHLVTIGVFRLSRNPIYVALLLLYCGAALMRSEWWPLVGVPGLIWVMTRGVIQREERYLERKFGDHYLAYKQRVRRWI